jgi:hypothetical protein
MPTLDVKADDREALRAEWVARIPRWYNPWAHLATTTALGAGFCALALTQIHGLAARELWILPATWIFANACEWRAHRDLLHRLTFYSKPLFTRHTLQHHRLYLTQDMEIRSSRELRLVLLPSFAIVLILAVTLPIAAALWLAGQRNLAALFIVMTQAYVVSYEWFHLSYHLPRDGFVGRLWLVRKLGQHHAIHHSPERMNRWNLNVNVPLWDWVRGTIYHGELGAQGRPQNAATAS